MKQLFDIIVNGELRTFFWAELSDPTATIEFEDTPTCYTTADAGADPRECARLLNARCREEGHPIWRDDEHVEVLEVLGISPTFQPYYRR